MHHDDCDVNTCGWVIFRSGLPIAARREEAEAGGGGGIQARSISENASNFLSHECKSLLIRYDRIYSPYTAPGQRFIELIRGEGRGVSRKNPTFERDKGRPRHENSDCAATEV